MVLAKPAISVSPVMEPRAPRPNNPASVENATSYGPKAIPIPITTHPAAMRIHQAPRHGRQRAGNQQCRGKAGEIGMLHFEDAGA